MEDHSGQMMVDMNVAYQDMGITEQQRLQQQEHQQVNGNGMPDASLQHATYFAVEELAMVQQQQQLDYAALQQQQREQQYAADMAHNVNAAINMSMSHQSGADLAQQSYVQSLTPLNQDGAPNQGFHFMDPQAAAVAAAQMAANGMGGQIRLPASMIGPNGKSFHLNTLLHNHNHASFLSRGTYVLESACQQSGTTCFGYHRACDNCWSRDCWTLVLESAVPFQDQS